MYETYIALLKHYKPDEETICQIVGFKFQSLASHSAPDSNNNSHHTTSNDSLYKITSYLLKHDLIDLDSLLVHLSPSDADCMQSSKDDMEAARQYAKKLSSIQLSSSGGPDLPLSSGSGGSGGGDTSSGGSSMMSAQPEVSQLVIQYQQHTSHRPKENQRICLVKSLIEIEDYVTAMKLVDKMPQWYLSANFEITVAVCRALEKNFIDSMYRRYCFKHSNVLVLLFN